MSTKKSDSKVRTQEEKLHTGWNGEIYNISFSLPSERKKKYAYKYELLFEQSIRFKDAILDIILKTNEDGENLILATSEGYTRFSANWTNIINNAKKIIEKGVKNLDKSLVIHETDWILDLFKCWLERTAQIEIDDPLGTFAEGGIDMQIANITARLDTTEDRKERTKLRRKKRKLTKRRKDLIKRANYMLKVNNPNFYEFQILSEIVSNLPPMRAKFNTILVNADAKKVDRTLWLIDKRDYQPCITAIRDMFDRYYLGLNRFMKFKYLQWLNSPNYTKGTKPRTKVEKLWRTILRNYYELMETRKLSIKPARIDNFGMFPAQYEEIDSAWEILTKKDLKPIAEIMNAPDLTIEKKSKKRNPDTKSKTRQVHWYAEVSVEDAKKGNLYPYVSHVKQYRRADFWENVPISLKESLLLHEVGDSLQVELGGDTFTGWDAMWDLCFTIFHNLKADPRTKEKYQAVYVVSRKREIEGLWEDLKEIEDDLKLLRKGKFDKKVHSIRRRFENRLKDYNDLLEKDREEEDRWYNKPIFPEDEQEYFQNELFQNLKGYLDSLAKDVKELIPPKASSSASSIISLPHYKKIIHPKIQEHGIDINEMIDVLELKNYLDAINRKHPENSLSTFEKLARQVENLKRRWKIEGDPSAEKHILNRTFRKKLIAKAFFKQIDYFMGLDDNLREDHDVMSKLYVNLWKSYYYFLEKAGFDLQK